MTKQSTLLGIREKLKSQAKTAIQNLIEKFNKKQVLFKGFRKTYIAEEDFVDDPSKRGSSQVESTVIEQLDYLLNDLEDYLRTTFSIEKTNASGIKAKLVVRGESWGTYTAGELLAFKGFLEGPFKAGISNIPTRALGVSWKPSTEEEYKGREIFETEKIVGETKTTLKKDIILSDPHIKDSPNRPPQVSQVSSLVKTGTYTSQEFSGEWPLIRKVAAMKMVDDIHTSVISALEEANSSEAKMSTLQDVFREKYREAIA